MREIKFRGKRVDNGEWVYGYLFGIWEQRHILWGTTNDIPNMIEVDPNTVGQYAGLKDKNGKEIYESDVLRERINAIFQVVWDERWAKFRLLCAGHYEYPEWSRGVQMEVIGNIHDNPELLGEAKACNKE